MTGPIIEDETTVDGLSLGERAALAYMVVAQTLVVSPPAWELLPLLSGDEFDALVLRVRGIVDDMREAAGQRGADLWRDCQ
jgi:hypothetical protein